MQIALLADNQGFKEEIKSMSNALNRDQVKEGRISEIFINLKQRLTRRRKKIMIL